MTASRAAHPTCDLARLQELLRHHVRALADDPSMAHALPPLMIWGAPGVGKSASIREVCKQEGIGFIDIRLAQREPVDLRGLPVPREDRVEWLLASDWPRDPSSRGILLFDELTAADRTLQVAAYEILLDRRLGDLYQVPQGWYLCAAGNRTSDRAAATTMSSALANRFCHVEIDPNLEGWIAWAQARGLHPAVLGFLRFKPTAFLDMGGNLERGWPSPRSWERAAHELSLAERTKLDEGTLRVVLAGLLGPGAAHELLAFRSWALQTDARAMLLGTSPIVIPERADRRFALVTALVYHLWRVPERARALARFLEIGLALPSDFASMAMVDALRGCDPERLSALLDHPLQERWRAQHGAALTARVGAPARDLAERLFGDDEDPA